MGKFLSGLSDHGQFLSGSPGSYFYHLTPGWLLFKCSPHLIESPTGATESLEPTHLFSGQRNLHRPAGPSLTYCLFKNLLQINTEQWNHFPESINYLLFPSDNPLKPTIVHCSFGQLKKKNVKKNFSALANCANNYLKKCLAGTPLTVFCLNMILSISSLNFYIPLNGCMQPTPESQQD